MKGRKFKFRKIPILIVKGRDCYGGWTVEISDKWENYKPLTYDEINWEDLAHHFTGVDHFNFDTRKEALESAKYVISEKGVKAKIWTFKAILKKSNP